MNDRRLKLAAIIVMLGLPAFSCNRWNDYPSGGDPAASPVPSPEGSLSVSPATLNLRSGESALISVSYDEGGKGMSAVDAAWTSSDPAVVTLSTDHGTTVTATAGSAGTALVFASFGGRLAKVNVTVESTPANPGPVFGHDRWGLVKAYPQDGGAPRTILNVPLGSTYRGFALNRSGTFLYGLHSPPGQTCQLQGFDLTKPRAADDPPDMNVYIPTWPLPPGAGRPPDPYGLECDGQGRIYMQGNGELRRYDPATDVLETLATISVSGFGDIALDSQDRIYSSHLFSAPNAFWIQRLGTIGGSPFYLPWGQAPSSGPVAFFPCGLAINGRDEVFTMIDSGTQLYKFVDLNGDGDALDSDVDPGDGLLRNERSVYCTLPGADLETYNFGITPTGGGGVLLNRQRLGIGPLTHTGIFWIMDRNGDGDADDADEHPLFNTTFLDEGFDGGCIVAPR